MATTKVLVLSLVLAAHAGLIGKYYDTIDWTGKFHYRVDEGVNFDWGLGGPRIRTDRFSVLWEGTINNAGIGTIIVEADDGVELWIGGQLVLSSLEDPYDPFPKSYTGPLQGKAIKLKYFENYGYARAKLRYSAKALTQADWDNWDKTRDISVYPVIPGSWFTAAAKPTGTDAVEVVEITASNIANAKWHTYALVKETTELRAEYFVDGVAPYSYDYSTEFVRKCGDFDLLGITETDNARLTGDRVIVKVTMGSVVDYFRPVAGANLCDMLRTNNLHEWAPDENGPWYKPERFQYNRWSLGGSADWAPNTLTFTDFRAYPAFWGGGEGGGCCYLDGDNDSWKKYTWERGNRAWKRAFKMELKSTLRPEWNPQVLKVKDTDGTWEVLAQIADGTSLKDKNVYRTGWNADLMSKHAQFIRNCSAYDAWRHEVVVKMRFGRYTRPTTTFHDPDPSSAWSGDLIAYFRPLKNKTLCDMLTSHQNHEWSDTGAVLDFVAPEYHTDDKMAGGSVWGWPRRDYVTGRPKDFNLAHLPFWAGDTAGFGVYYKGQGDGAWGRSFQLLVQQQLRPDINEGDLSTSGNYLTNFLHLGTADESINVAGVARPLFKDELGLCGGNNWHYWGKSCYTVVETDVVYDDAVAGCKANGGSLVSIHDAGENKFLVGLANTPVWIDGNDNAKEGTWVHTDGTPFDFNDWAAGEPMGGTNENCASLVNWGDKFWQDRHCTWTKLKYICKKSAGQIPQIVPKAGQSATPKIGNSTSGDNKALVWTKVTNNRPPYVWSNKAVDSFIDFYSVAIYSPTSQEVTLTTRHDDGLSITLEDKSVYMSFGTVWEDKTAKFTLSTGWSQLVLKFHEDSGSNYWWLKLSGTGLRWKYEK